MGLMLIGSENTNNALASRFRDRYNNIEEAFCLSLSSWEMLNYVNNNVKPSNVQADWLKGIAVAIDFLQEQIQ